MSEKFRVWFILEISLYSLPVVLGAAITWLALSVEAPLHVRLIQMTFIVSCCLSVKAVWQLMQFVFHDKSIKKPKVLLAFILFWIFNWVPTGIIAASSIGLTLGFILPVLVVLHLGYLARKGLQFNTYKAIK
jgi:hypothetical protein